MDDKGLKMYIGKEIKKYRLAKKLNQSELGKLVGVKNNTISAYERGVNSPEQNILFKLASALDIKVDDLFPPTTDNNSAHEVIQMATDELDVNDLMLIKKITEKALQLEGKDREKLMDSVRLAIDYFDKFNQ